MAVAHGFEIHEPANVTINMSSKWFDNNFTYAIYSVKLD